jgi:predicted XRE-type DNA-binding protein
MWRAPVLLALLTAFAVAAQDNPLDRVVKRLDQLETENTRLKSELTELRKLVKDLQASQDKAVDQLEVQSQRVSDTAQSKVEAGQKQPLKLSGLVLMNAYRYTGHIGEAELPLVGVGLSRNTSTGATLRQSQITLQYDSSNSFIGANLSGRLQIDFFGGSLINAQNHLARIRVGNVSLNWARRTVMVGIEKPILSPREPETLAQLGISPLANSGNLWLWQPQIRYEERVKFTENSGLDLRAGVYQTNETFTPAGFTGPVPKARPALQGRFEFYRTDRAGRRLAIAPGFHVSETQVLGAAARSYAASVDWNVPVLSRLEWTGFAFKGQNLTGLGVSGIRQPYYLTQQRFPNPVRSGGGWTQLAITANSKWKFHLFSGMHDDRNSDVRFLSQTGIGRNLSYGVNTRILLAPNVLLGLEAMQIRTGLVTGTTRTLNRYDLAIGYLF